jgi:hypothetical protein
MSSGNRKVVSLWVSPEKAEYYQQLAQLREQSRSEFILEMADSQIRSLHQKGKLLKRSYESEENDE